MNCDGCRFFKHGDMGGFGECRRRPPVVLSHDTGKKLTDFESWEHEVYHRTAFPVLAVDSWCGEFQPV